MNMSIWRINRECYKKRAAAIFPKQKQRCKIVLCVGCRCKFWNENISFYKKEHNSIHGVLSVVNFPISDNCIPYYMLVRHYRSLTYQLLHAVSILFPCLWIFQQDKSNNWRHSLLLRSSGLYLCGCGLMEVLMEVTLFINNCTQIMKIHKNWQRLFLHHNWCKCQLL